jgi:predicted O-linked N-acetylglucosamine transferase (SPINDLY family)
VGFLMPDFPAESISDWMALALRHHRAGGFAEAERIYRQVLEVSPDHADALHLLGDIARRYGRYDVAYDYISRAIGINPTAALYYYSLALVYEPLGRYADAAICAQRAIELKPDFPEAHNDLGQCLLAQGRLDEAVTCFGRALDLRPNYAFAHNNLGTALARQGRLDDAVRCFREALRLNPEYPEVYGNLGNALATQERWDEAAASFREMLQRRPDSAPTYNHLGMVLAAQGRLDEATAAYQHALLLDPRLVVGHHNLAVALHEQGRLAEAVASYQQALDIDPGCVLAHINLATILQEERRFDEAIAHIQTALRIEPQNAKAYEALGRVFANQGKIREARAGYEQALAIRPHARTQIILATTLPLVYESMEHLRAERRALIENVRRLEEEGVCLDLTQELAPSPFYLAYQGENDCDLRRALAGLCRAPATALPGPFGRLAADHLAGGATLPPPAVRKIKVGFISTYFTDHTVGRLTQSLVANLSRERLSVTVLSAATLPDKVTDFFREKADQFITVPANLQAARRLVAELALDILYYTDIGMHTFTGSLAFSRLAPVQCVTWGHPETTGLPTIDYFISSELFEPEDADQHYTEKLIRLKSFPPYASPPALPVPLKSRTLFDLPDDAHLYACVQSLYKLHPEFDEILAGILRRDLKAIIVLSLGNHPHWHEALVSRFAKSIPDVHDRIRFVGWLSSDDFLSLHAISDVVLDPPHFGGGRTSYEFFAFGLPVVTLPSRFLRGRLTLGMYRKMQLLDCVAASPVEYVDIAVKIATEPAYRAEIRSRILVANNVLYEDQSAIRELEIFFAQAAKSFA